MFCTKCGYKILDEASFCSKCGQPINRIDIMKSIPNADINNSDKKNEVLEIFRKYFDDGREFGNEFYVFGTDIVLEVILSSVDDAFGHSEDEIKLFAFNAKGLFDQGFLLTDKYFYWKDIDKNCVRMDDVYDIRVDKRILANVMYFITDHKTKFPDIYLTGIDNLNTFLFKFREFIKEWNRYKNENIKYGYSELSDIGNLINDSYKTIYEGTPMFTKCSPYIPDDWNKAVKARQNFGIPNNNKIYIITDSSIWGNCKEGFAVCDLGIFYKFRGEQGIIDWNKFMSLDIKKGWGSIKLGEKDFSCDCKSVVYVMNYLQYIARNNMNIFLQ